MRVDAKVIFGVIAIAVALIVYSNKNRSSSDWSDREDPVVSVDPDDSEMNAAIAEARRTVDQFILALECPKSSQSGFAVKYGFSDDGSDQLEFMWVHDVTFHNGEFHGIIANEPRDVKSVRIADRVTVPKDKIVDWCFFQNGDCVGGYTQVVLNQRGSR